MKPICNAVGCGREMPGRGSLMRRAHWFAVPAILRRQVNATWTAFQKRQGEYLDYIEARDEALRFVAEGEGRLDAFKPDLPRIKAMQALREEREAKS